MDGENRSNFLQSCNVFQVNNERRPDGSNLFISRTSDSTHSCSLYPGAVSI